MSLELNMPVEIGDSWIVDFKFLIFGFTGTAFPTNNAEMTKVAAHRTAKVQHAILLAKFMVFQIVLVTADIVTDIWSGFELFGKSQQKDIFAKITLALIFAPFLIRVILTIASFGRCFQWNSGKLILDQRRFYLSKHELGTIIWDFPLMQPIRFESPIKFQSNPKIWSIKAMFTLVLRRQG